MTKNAAFIARVTFKTLLSRNRLARAGSEKSNCHFFRGQFEIKYINRHQNYNNHLYALVHVVLTVEKFQTVQALSERFQISKDKVREILEFLVSCRLALRKKDRYEVGTARIHLGNDSKFVSRHHLNWVTPA